MISGLTPDALSERDALSEGDALSERDSTVIPVEIRKAAMRDIAPLLALINGYAARGIMLPRTEFEISENIRDFSVAISTGKLVGCGALHFYSPSVGEVRSLAVEDCAKTHGVGRRMVEWLMAEARAYTLDAVFAFTYVPQFFHKMGFEEVERGILPLKAWKDCLRCPKFHCCDEIAMVCVLEPDRWTGANPQTRGMNLPNCEIEIDLVKLPIVQSNTLT
jgi:amino-acid N-acetyltransferase